MDLALNNLQRLICHKPQTTNQHLLTSSPAYVSPSTPERTQVVPSLLPVVSEADTSTFARTCARDFRPPVFLSHFWPCYSATTVCFIYLFNYSLDFL